MGLWGLWMHASARAGGVNAGGVACASACIIAPMVPLILGVITNAFDCLVVNWLDLRLNVYGKSLNIHDMYCRHLQFQYGQEALPLLYTRLRLRQPRLLL